MAQTITVCLLMGVLVSTSLALPTESPSEKTGKSAQRRVSFRDRNHDDGIHIGGTTISDFDRNRFVTPNPTRIVTVRTSPGFQVTPSVPNGLFLNQGTSFGGIAPSDGLFHGQILPLGASGGFGLGGGIVGGLDSRTIELAVARNPSIILQYPEILSQYPHLLLQYPQLAIQYPQLRQYVDPRYLGFGGNIGFGGNGINNQFQFRRVFPSNFGIGGNFGSGIGGNFGSGIGGNFGSGIGGNFGSGLGGNFGGGIGRNFGGGIGGLNDFNRFNSFNGLQPQGLSNFGTGLDFNRPIDINGLNRPILSTLSPIAVTTLSPFNRNIRFNKK
ncbi:hypothetical protein FHG87_002401 [Trinorchestia longiramus]|nr:hypothetical protein FHG87_002401 [Trinorchestia longiramus]